MPSRFLSAVLLSVCLAVQADEGMWTFENPPLAQMKAKYGFAPDDKWLEHIRLSAVEFGSGSGAFVSKDGLVLTNHHVGLRSMEKISEPGDKDYAVRGFVAKTQAEEIKIPDLKLYTLMQMVNVTEKVNGAVKAGMDEKQAAGARLEKLAKLASDLDQREGLLADPVTLYEGGEYWIYTYRVHKDVRLVMAPEAQVAFFGGDPDNFTFPRQDLDFALFRVYEGGEAYHPPHHLALGRGGAKAGELTFVVGRPGRTHRLDTIAQLRYQREIELPAWNAGNEAHLAALHEYGKASEAKARKISSEVFFTENSLKAGRGELGGLLDQAAFSELERKEADLRAAVAKNAEMTAAVGGSWARIEEATELLRPLARVNALVNSRGSKLLKTALDLVRCAQELDRPAAERLADYRSKDGEAIAKWRLEKQLQFDETELDTYLIAKGLEDLQAGLEPEHPFRKAVLGDRTPAELAKEVVAGTQIQQMYIRRDLIQGRSKAVAKSKDPLVQLAKVIETFRRDMDGKRESLQDLMKDHAGRIARARFAVYGRTFYPDATGTLRFSYGSVEGYAEQGRFVEPFTTFGGLYERARQMGPEAANGAWALPERWQVRKDKLDLSVPLNFCHKVDIVGGNSGSPALNVKGELIGLVFDGNLQSLPGRFYYDEKVNRTVSLDARAILESLTKIYEAPHLAEELSAQ